MLLNLCKDHDLHYVENVSSLDKENLDFLNQHENCITDSLPDHLTRKRLEDHHIDLVSRSSPPNRPPYKVSVSQQEEIMAQVKELLDKGLVQPSSSPFCSLVLLVQKKDGMYRM